MRFIVYYMSSLLLVLSTEDISSNKETVLKRQTHCLQPQNFFNYKNLYKLGARGHEYKKTKEIYNKKKKRKKKHFDYWKKCKTYSSEEAVFPTPTSPPNTSVRPPPHPSAVARPQRVPSADQHSAQVLVLFILKDLCNLLVDPVALDTVGLCGRYGLYHLDDCFWKNLDGSLPLES